jgi:hypothetical protein
MLSISVPTSSTQLGFVDVKNTRSKISNNHSQTETESGYTSFRRTAETKKIGNRS